MPPNVTRCLQRKLRKMSSEKLREVALIAETHFIMTFGTERIAAVREAASALGGRDAEIAKLRADLATYVNDTVTTENRFIDLEFAATERDALLAEAMTALEDAVQGLHNGFEPDNQSAVYKRVHAALTKLKAGR